MICRSASDRLNGKAQHTGAAGPAGNARNARIHHEADAGDRDARLRNISGQNDAARPTGVEDSILFRNRKACVEGQYLHTTRSGHTGDCIGRILNIALAAKEDKDVTGP